MKQPANTPTQSLEHYRELLQTKRSELMSSSRAQLDTLIGPGGSAPEDLAPVFHEQFIALRVNRLDYLKLKRVDAALARMEDETYGTCVDCEEPISARRLEAIPWADRCIACEERSVSVIEEAPPYKMAA